MNLFPLSQHRGHVAATANVPFQKDKSPQFLKQADAGKKHLAGLSELVSA